MIRNEQTRPATFFGGKNTSPAPATAVLATTAPARAAPATAAAALATVLLAATVIAAAAGTARATERRPGVVRLSDGKEYRGEVWFKRALRIYEGTGSRRGRYVNLSPDELARLTFLVKNRAMERPWRFKNAGSDEKEYLPGTYPLIDLRSEVRLKTGNILRGHLLNQPVYIRFQDGDNPMDYVVKKFHLKYRYKGKVGQTFKDIVYATAVLFTDAATPAGKEKTPAAGGATLSGTVKGLGRLEQVAAFGINRMRAYKGEVADAEQGSFRIPNLPKDVYDVAVLTDTGVFVGLSDVGAATRKKPRPLTEEDARAVAATAAKFRDFFEEQEVLAVKGHCEAAKVLMHQRRVHDVHDQKKLGAKEIHRLGIWSWHKLRTEWRINAHGRANLFRWFEAREGLKRPIRLVKELGGVAIDPAAKKLFGLNYTDPTSSATSGATSDQTSGATSDQTSGQTSDQTSGQTSGPASGANGKADGTTTDKKAGGAGKKAGGGDESSAEQEAPRNGPPEGMR